MSQINMHGRTFFLSKGTYEMGGATAITLYTYILEEGGMTPWIDLTTNIPGTVLKPDECLVKVWSENEPFIKGLLKSGFFEDTKKRIPSGFVEAHIWKIVKEIPTDAEIGGVSC